MKNHAFILYYPLLLGLAYLAGITPCAAQTGSQSSDHGGGHRNNSAHRKSYPPGQVEAGRTLFRQNCSFCHGRDATGGETGPDLTRSRLVTEDADGEKIVPIIRTGRQERGMPPFDLPADQINDLVAFIHTQQNNAVAAAGRGRNGGRKGVDPSDLQTGNAEAGKRYFNGAGGCSTCHSPTGDLAQIASRYQGLELEEQMLYPKHAKSKITVTLASGQTITGTLAYQDEFTIGITDSAGLYRSWRTRDVHFTIDASVNAHVEQFSKYTDADIHNLMAYLQTLR
jgi:cytochrome c oxidase cbb3-type subunit III